jgi:nicotinate-nucleotide adenylyltransferase
MRVGLLGGSFNPAHAGHRHVAEQARRRLRLGQVWLMVSPGNPLKPARGMAPFAERLASARAVADGRRVVATGIEAALGTRYTIDTLRALRRRFPRISFVWLMGADILEQLPRWRRWTAIARSVPLAVLPRPTYNHRALAGRAARRLRAMRRPAHEAVTLASHAAPAWAFLPAPQHAASATAIREAARSIAKEHCHRQTAPHQAAALRPAGVARARPKAPPAVAHARPSGAPGRRDDARHPAQEGDRRRPARPAREVHARP